ncbi:hypothetical protein evm_014818 [Chilo suppressalis]|nr:hypothetical protein evm_014818 [Chilo suppressalis]
MMRQKVSLEISDLVGLNPISYPADPLMIIRLEKSSDRADKGFSWTAYYDVDAINAFLQNVSKSYPDVTEVIVGGESYEGRQITGVRINTPSQNKNDKPVVFIESGIFDEVVFTCHRCWQRINTAGRAIGAINEDDDITVPPAMPDIQRNLARPSNTARLFKHVTNSNTQ